MDSENTILSFPEGDKDSHLVYSRLSPLSPTFPLSWKDTTYPTVMHAVYAALLVDSRQKTILLPYLSVQDMKEKANSLLEEQSREQWKSLIQKMYDLLTSSQNDECCHLPSSSVFAKQEKTVSEVMREAFQHVKQRNLYYVEKKDICVLPSWGVQLQELPFQGWNVWGTTIEHIASSSSRHQQFAPFASVIYELYYFYQFLFDRWTRDCLSLEPYFGRTVMEARTLENGAFQQYLTKRIPYSLMDEKFKEHIFTSFVSKRLPIWEIIEIECQFPGNMASWIMTHHFALVEKKIWMSYETHLLCAFLKDHCSHEFPSSTPSPLLIRKTQLNLDALSYEQRRYLVERLSIQWDTASWSPSRESDRELLIEKTNQRNMMIHFRSLFYHQCVKGKQQKQNAFPWKIPIMYHVRPQSSLIHMEMQKSASVFHGFLSKTNIQSKDVVASALDPHFPLLWLPEISLHSSMPIRLFFPSPFHYLLFQKWRQDQEHLCTILDIPFTLSHLFEIYGMLTTQGRLSGDVIESLETKKVPPIPFCHPQHFLQYPKDADRWKDRCQQWHNEQMKRLLHFFLRQRLLQHSYLQQLLLSTELLGWTSFRFQSSDAFLGYVSEDKEESFFEWQYHNVVGKVYHTLRSELWSFPPSVHDQKMHLCLSFVFAWLSPNTHSFDIVFCQTTMLMQCLEKSRLFTSSQELTKETLPEFSFLFQLSFLFPKEMEEMKTFQKSQQAPWVLWETMIESFHLSKAWKTHISLFFFCLWSLFLSKLNQKQLPLRAFLS